MTILKKPVPKTASATLPPENRAQTVLSLKKDTSLTPPRVLVSHLLFNGRFTLLIARDKCGKTTLVWWMSAMLAAGGKVFGQSVRASRVLIVSLEEALGDSKARAVALGGKAIDGVFVLSNLDHPKLSRLEVLQANIDAVKPEVVIIDTLTAYASGEVADENSTAAWMAILPRLQKIAHKQGIALLVLHHAQKSGGEARGSTTITAVPDVLIDLSTVKGDDSTQRKLAWKGRYGTGEQLITFDAATSRFSLVASATDAAAAERPSAQATPSVDSVVEQKVLRVLATVDSTVGMPVGDVRRLTKGRGERVDRALARLVQQGAVVNRRQGRTSRYALIA